MRIWQKVLRLRRRKDTLSLLRDRLDHFRGLVDKNNQVLELIAQAGEMLSGEYVFDSQYLKNLAHDLESAVRGVIYDLNGVTADRYPQLADTLRRIADEMQAVLESRVIVAKTDYVIPLEKLDDDSSDVAGAKMARLASIGKRLECRVPPGFVISTYTCQRLLALAGIDRIVEDRFARLDAESPESLTEAAAELRERVLAIRLPHDIQRAIGRQAEKLVARSGCRTLAVRSSALGEDSELSFAGQFTTLLGVPPEGVASAYKEVLASLYSAGVMRYRKNHHLHPARGLMGVGCLCMVPARAGGVLHSLNPSSPGLDVMIVAAARGLGKTVVDGSDPVDRFEISRFEPHEVVTRDVVTKARMLVKATGGGVEHTSLEGAASTEPSVTEEQLRELAATALRIERYLKCAVDVEWAVDEVGELVILQARPLRVTTDAPVRHADVVDALGRSPIVFSGRGSVACNGIGFGRVRIVRDDDSLENLEDDAVLVAKGSTPRLASVVATASAVITDVGTATGHLAAIAREFRVPAIVDTGIATQALHDGDEVTIDADANVVYSGRVKTLLDQQLLRSSSFEETHEFRLLRRLLKRVAPLNLRDPQARSFTAANCATYHDIVRFAHEMAVRELSEGYWVDPTTRNRFVRRLDLAIPLDLVLIDIGGAILPTDADGPVDPEEVVSAPLRSLLAGLTAEGVWVTAPARMDANAFMASATRSAPWLGPAAVRPQANLAIASREYLNLSLRLGFHFNIVDCFLGATRNDNYIYFRFTGGVTELTRRSRRAALLKRILERYDFVVDAKGDLVIGRIKKVPAETIYQLMEMVGRLIGFTRQLDIVLSDDAVVDRCFDNFVAGRYDVPGG